MDKEPVARRITVSGRVQGVGYRPFVYRRAVELGLTGWVLNGSGQVTIHVEGASSAIARFETDLVEKAPPLARPRLAESIADRIEPFSAFEIRQSAADARPDIHLPPDLFCCDDCLAEMRDPSERRFGYAFTNCTQCGPRYTIIERMPYDRPHTSMADFELCPECRHEYEDPLDRRFHAQPLACPACGPQLRFRGRDGEVTKTAALEAAVGLLRSGGIVAIKGIGGYHLVCDAANDAAAGRLRTRKNRPHKPLAVMFPACGPDGLDLVRRHVDPDGTEAAAIADPARPIVLVRKRRPDGLSQQLAPGVAELGVFLPYSPLHSLVLDGFGGPLVATSGNVSGEPVITDSDEAESRLAAVADAFLHHDRAIVRPADDAVVRIIGGRARHIRLGRGVAPMEIDLPAAMPEPTLAVGGHLKCTIALGWGRRAVVSPHIGDLDSPRSREVFQQVVRDLQALYGIRASRIVCDLHPDYAGTRWADTTGLPVVRAQHHMAHASALAGEHPEVSNWLVFAWDGIGYGLDGTLWGAEGFAGAPGRWSRVASIRPFRVTGGDRVGREPWRAAAGLMWEAGRDRYASDARGQLLHAARQKQINTITTSSAGRLFDAAACLSLGTEIASFEGQGPMLLESAARESTEGKAIAPALPLSTAQDGILRLDWEPLLDLLADDRHSAVDRALAFHVSLAEALVGQVETLKESIRFDAVGCTGGVFQNRLLGELVTERLARTGVRVVMPEQIPANDGGLAFGQLVEALFANQSRPEARQSQTA